MEAFEVLTITPSIAKELLKGNTRNRPLKKHHVERLAEDMAENKWVYNGVPIIFNGKLIIDGQHRLEACIKANKPFKTAVVRGVDADAFVTIDVGVKRTAADTLATKGHSHATVLAAAASIVHVYQAGDMSDSFSIRKGRTNRYITEAIKQYVALPNSVEHCLPMSTKIIPTSIVCAMHYIFSKIDSVQADGFIKRLATGNDVKADTPMSLLRNRMIENYSSNRKHTRAYIISLVIKTWNAERNRVALKQLRGWQSSEREQFPIAL